MPVSSCSEPLEYRHGSIFRSVLYLNKLVYNAHLLRQENKSKFLHQKKEAASQYKVAEVRIRHNPCCFGKKKLDNRKLARISGKERDTEGKKERKRKEDKRRKRRI
jgi:hypothetical protein